MLVLALFGCNNKLWFTVTSMFLCKPQAHTFPVLLCTAMRGTASLLLGRVRELSQVQMLEEVAVVPFNSS